jgi:pantoate--beta-alanine ligase
MTACLIGLGSNLGDRVAQIRAALDRLSEHPQIQLGQVSALVETAPVGGPPGQGRYLNAAAVLQTDLAPPALVAVLLEVEQALGRTRQTPCGPRTIDLDLLLYGEEVCTDAAAIVPHPRMHQRHFVLVPAVQIAGGWRHPTMGRTLQELLSSLPPPAPGEIGMQVFLDPWAIQRHVLALRRQGRTVGLVPTMGALHEGHLSLVRRARQEAEVVAVTIFVNPTQFGPQEDYSRYPRTLEADLAALSAAGCDLVLVPDAEAIYPSGFSTYVQPPAVAEPWEGVCRPGHFRGVATVVLKLFHLIPADVACFGEKDYQQLRVIQRMVEDLNVPIRIVPCPTVREPDGLAMSSRNRYLAPHERQQALGLVRALGAAREEVARGERDASVVRRRMREVLQAAGITRIDYATLVDPQTLHELNELTGPARALIAAYVGSTRLIDNALLPTPGEELPERQTLGQSATERPGGAAAASG